MGWLLRLRRVLGAENVPQQEPVAVIGEAGIRPKLDRDGVLSLLQEQDNSDYVPLYKYDLTGADLSRLDLRSALFSFYDEVSDARITADLVDVRFTDAILTGTDFRHAVLDRATFWQADLKETTFHAARAHGAFFGQANLEHVDFYGCDLSGANFWQAKMQGVNLGIANIANVTLTDVDLGGKLLQEDRSEYEAYFSRWYITGIDNRYLERHLKKRYIEAAEIYMNLKNAYTSHGRYREASAAYLKERRLRRKSHVLWYARTHYADQLEQYRPWSPLRLWFYLRHTVFWLADWLSDITSGYGERPFQAAAWAIVIVGLFTVIFQRVEGIQNASTWLDYFNYSLASFSTIGFETLHPITPLAQTLTSIESLLGIALLALFMFTLGNRINRG